MQVFADAHTIRVASIAFRYTCTFTIVVLRLLARAPVYVSPCFKARVALHRLVEQPPGGWNRGARETMVTF